MAPAGGVCGPGAGAESGPGGAPDQMERIFEPFFTTKGVGKGTGLGLAQVIGFAKQSRGDVAMESEVGRGTTFTLYLPRADAKPATVEPPAAESASEPGAGRGCVLVVEDNQTVGEFAADLLEEIGYAAVWVASAQAALDLLAATPDRFDAVFTDVVMPGMSGVDFAQALRAERPGLPVVLTSGYTHVLAQEGAHGFELLHKPYSMDGLSRALRRVMGGQ